MSTRRHLGPTSVVADRQRADSPRLVFNESIGDVTLDMARAAVERRYGKPARAEVFTEYFPVGTRYEGEKLERAVYRLHDGALEVQYVAGRVKTVETTSTYYRTASRIGVGTHLPRDRCIRLDDLGRTGPRGCRSTWRNFGFDAECLDAWLTTTTARSMTLLHMHRGRRIERVLIGDPDVILPCF